MKKILLYLLLFPVLSAVAQKNQESPKKEKSKSSDTGMFKGYIVIQKGDTIYGKFKDKRATFGFDNDYIEMSHPDLFHKYVLFTSSSASRPKKYEPADIKGFRINQESYYTTISEGSKGKNAIFARPLADGVIALYARRMPTTRLPQEFYLKKGFEMVTIRGEGANEKLAIFFEDHEELHTKITNGDFAATPEEMLIMVRTYNDWFEQQKGKR
jgi:hypothetical protein